MQERSVNANAARSNYFKPKFENKTLRFSSPGKIVSEIPSSGALSSSRTLNG